MSALPPKAAAAVADRRVRFVPLTDIVGVTLFRAPDPKSATHQCVVGRGLLQGD